MKIPRHILLSSLIVVLAIIFCGSVNTLAAEKTEDEKCGVYIYPLYPGDSGWGDIDHPERVRISQIPEELLNQMSTETLIETVLDYPCFSDMIYYDNAQTGFINVKKYFNGLRELFGRKDAARLLLEKYLKIQNIGNPGAAKTKNERRKRLKVYYYEVMLAQKEILNSFDKSDLKILNEVVNSNYKYRCENEIGFPSYSGFYDCVSVQRDEELRDYGGYVSTPLNSWVYVIYRTGNDWTPDDISDIKDQIEESFPNAEVVGDATKKYNCHAYAWVPSTGFWMEDPSPYWTDGSYTLRSTNTPTATNQIVYYPCSNGGHSGRVISLTGNQIQSKWGALSVVRHSVTDCPYINDMSYASNILFYALYSIP